jgi:alanine racemase
MSRSWVVVDHAALRHNLAVIRDLVGEGPIVCAVVKAGGYGHGAVEVARTALGAGASWLAVAHAVEGAELRAAGIDAPVLLLSEPVGADEIRLVVEHGLRTAVYTPAVIDALAATGAPVPVHLKVDTGMRRVGADPADAVALARRVERSGRLRLEGVWTHCAVADEPANAFTGAQLQQLAEVTDTLRRAGVEVPLRHAANSAAVLTRPDGHLDLVRPGIALYGVAPAPALSALVPLRPVLSWHSTVALVKKVRAGQGVSYGHHGRPERDTVVATVPVGYADGLPRRWGLAGGVVLIGGRRRPVLGVVTMDQVIVDCGPDADIAVGDEVVLIGGQGDGRLDVAEPAAATGTIAYEILTGIGPRVQRRHIDTTW